MDLGAPPGLLGLLKYQGAGRRLDDELVRVNTYSSIWILLTLRLRFEHLNN